MPLACWVGPGYLLSRWLVPVADPLERGVLSLGLGIVTVVPTAFLITLLGGVPITPWTIAASAVGWGVVALALQRFARRPAQPTMARHGGGVLALVIALAGAMALFTTPYALRATDIFWHCPHLSCLYLLEDGSGPGLTVWHPLWERTVTHLFAHPTDAGFGLGPVLAIQRAGNAAFMAQPFAFLSAGGLVIAQWCTDFLILGGAILLARRHLRQTSLLIGLSALFLFGVHAIASYQVNENGIALALSMLALHLTLRTGPASVARAAACGVIFGHLLGIRPATILLLPAALWLTRGALRHRTALLTAVAVAALPWLLTNTMALDGPLHYPQLEAGKVEQTVMGVDVTFHPLGWPVADQLMRPPDHPFPTLIRLPLEVLQGFGAPLLALVLLGFATVVRLDKRRALGVLLWLVPIPLLLSLIVTLDYQKLSYVLLACAPLLLAAAAGAARFEATRSQRLTVGVVMALLLVVVPTWMTDWQLPIDDRDHIDRSYDVRDTWTEDVVRESLTRASFLPYLSAELGAPVGARLLAHAAPPSRDAPIADGIVAIWTPPPVGRRPLLPDPVSMETASEPRIPPEYIGVGGVPGVGPATGRLLFVVELPSPAPEKATVALHPRGRSYTLSVTGDGARSEGARYVTVLVISRDRPPQGAPAIIVDRQAAPVWTVTMWGEHEGRLIQQPRVASNQRTEIGWTGSGFELTDAPAGMKDGGVVEFECKDGGVALGRACIGPTCVRILADGALRPTALLIPDAPGVPGIRLFTWGAAGQHGASFGTRACERRFVEMMGDAPPFLVP